MPLVFLSFKNSGSTTGLPIPAPILVLPSLAYNNFNDKKHVLITIKPSNQLALFADYDKEIWTTGSSSCD